MAKETNTVHIPVQMMLHMTLFIQQSQLTQNWTIATIQTRSPLELGCYPIVSNPLQFLWLSSADSALL